MYTHTYIRMYIHTYVCTYIHTYIHAYVHTYIHIDMLFSIKALSQINNNDDDKGNS